MRDLAGKIAVVTGAASGIGKAIAEKLGAQAMKVVLADIEEGPLQAAALEMRSKGVTVLPVLADVSEAYDVERLLRTTMESYGAVHVLCNNAGVIDPTPRGAMWQSPLEDWRWIVNVNVWGVVHGIRVFVPTMLSQDVEAHIVNVASVAGLVSMPFFGIYSMTKHAIVNLTETLHRELALRNAKVRATVVCPVWTRTSIGKADRNRPSSLKAQEMNQAPPEMEGMNSESYLEALYAHYEEPLRSDLQRVVQPEYVAERVLHAIQNNVFYVFTHSAWNEIIRHRVEDLMQCRNPREFL